MLSAPDSPLDSPIGGSSNSPFFGGRAKSYNTRGGVFGGIIATCASVLHFMETRHSRLLRLMAVASILLFIGGMWSFYHGSDDNLTVEPPPQTSAPPTPTPPPPPSAAPKKDAFDIEYHTLPPDFPAPTGAEDAVLVIKTGAQVLWQRLPIHLLTTTTRTPNYLVFSDLPEYIGTTPVHDCLKDVDPSIREQHQDFDIYRRMRYIKPFPGFYDTVGEEALTDSIPKSRPYNIEIAKMDLKGGWDLDKYKNVPILYQAYRAFPDKHWYIFIDADSYIFFGNLLRYLNANYDWRKELYLGSQTLLGNELFAHGGTGYVISGPAARKVVVDHPELEHQFEEYATKDCCGDHVVARVLEKVGIKLSYERGRMQGEPWYGLRWDKDTWCSKILTFHHVGQGDIQELWEFERSMHQVLEKDKEKNGGYIIYGDLYHRFVRPFLTSVEQAWDNLSNDRWFEMPSIPEGFSEEHLPSRDDVKNISDDRLRIKWEEFWKWNDLEREAAKSSDKAACAKVCEADGNCLQWKWVKRKCVTNHSVIFGKRDPNSNTDNAWWSGWVLDRVDKVRQEQSCEKSRPGGFPAEERRKGGGAKKE